jgi:hypothetical protein
MKPAAILLLAGAFQHAAEPSHKPLELRDPVQDKNFYLLSILQRNAAARESVRKDSVLARLSAERISALDHAVSSCNTDIECNAAAFHWSDAQIVDGARALAALYPAIPAIRAVAGELRNAGAYLRYQDLPDRELLERAWSDCVRGINRAIDVYALGKPPRYPLIDSATYDTKSEACQRVIQHLAAVLQEDRAEFDLA